MGRRRRDLGGGRRAASPFRPARAPRALLPEGPRPADAVTRGARMGAVEEKGAADEADAEIIEVGADLLMPGLADTHVHVNEPGRAGWGGFEPVVGGAAAGGITTLV